MLYRNLSSYFRDKYGKRLKKICIDGGFSCPNRDGTCGVGGCIYCGERGSGEHIAPALSIGEQVQNALSLGGDGGYVAYFQNFTNTYAPVPVLRQRYDSALIDRRILALAIGTRPDCIDGDVADLIASYQRQVDVWVELGLQTASDISADVIRRGYPTSRFFRAMELLNSRQIPAVVHMIIGLPGEGEREIDATVDAINSSGAWGVKIHSIYVMEGTTLAGMYLRGEYSPPSLEEYARLAARALARLNPEIVVHRLSGDCPDGLLVAPEWNRNKNAILDSIRRVMKEQGWRQGSLYREP